jgi:hypothetical protein
VSAEPVADVRRTGLDAAMVVALDPSAKGALMPVTMIMDWPGVTAEQYDAVRELVQWETDKPTGGMCHIATVTPEGLRVTDVWESAEAFQQFVDERLMPGVQQVGVEGEPNVDVYPNHALFIP